LALVDLAATMQTVTHDGRATAYRLEDRTGSGDAGADSDAGDAGAGGGGGPGTGAATLLCVHGSGGTHAVWKSQLARLSRERPVAALDLSGHGESDDVDTDPGPATLDAYVADVLAVADEIDADVLVGNSLGGAVVLTAVLDADVEPDAAVLAGSGAKLAVLDELRNWLAGEGGGFDRAVEFLHRDDMLFDDPGERELAFSKRAMRECGREVVERDFLSCHTFDVRDRLEEIAVPVFALTGEHDRLTPPEYHAYVAENVNDGEWATVPGAAHLSMLEEPETFNRELGAFLESRAL
jgi:pimeloyl-ACP methyl ester carboxylesterase